MCKEGLSKMSDVIITKNLTKIYQTVVKEAGLKGSLKALVQKSKFTKTALADFDLQIAAGETVGLIGPNGAGKTTLIKLLTGVIFPTSGDLSVFGYTPYLQKDDFKKKFAVVMGQKSQLWWDLPAIDSFLLNKEIYEIPDSQYQSTLKLFTELYGICQLLNVQVRNLSLGERMKMELVAALLHNPRVLFLDEPTIGLDAVAQKQIRQFLKQINETKGITIILTSHYMEDIRHLCKRTIVVRNGAKIYDGDLQTLLDKYQVYRRISVSFETATDLSVGTEVEWIHRDPFKTVFQVRKTEVKSVLQKVMADYEIDDISIEDEDIGSVVEKIYSQGTGGAL
jgi:ABC-2 type transport system ATP-binding protein